MTIEQDLRLGADFDHHCPAFRDAPYEAWVCCTNR